MKIVVGSTNPVKIEATKIAFEKVWPGQTWLVEGWSVASSVSDQPMSDAETIEGATNRAKAAIKLTRADYGVGIEGGIQQIGDHWFDCGWVVVIDQKGTIGIGSSARVLTPPKMMEKIMAGKELGQVIDDFFETSNAKQSIGHFGLMTNHAITRTSGYVDGVVMALVRFLHPHLF